MRTLSLAALAASAAAAGYRSGPREVGTYDAQEFVAVGSSPSDATVAFSVALPTRNHEMLDSMLARISDPTHPEYANYLTQEEVNNYLAPEQKLFEEVGAYLKNKNMDCETLPLGFSCKGSVANVEKMLETKFTAYTHVPKNNNVIHRIAPEESFTFPEELSGKVQFFTQLAEFPTVRMRMGNSKSKAGHSGRDMQAVDLSIVPETLRAMYKLAQVADQTSSPAVIGGPIEFQSDTGFMDSDLATFVQEMAFPVGNFTEINNQQGGDLESTLDVDYFGAIASFGNVQNYFMSLFTGSGWMYEFVNWIASQPTNKLPSVMSLSWGWSEEQQCQIVQNGPCTTGNSTAYVVECNAGFMAASLRGLTIAAASGDSGAHGRTDPSCTDDHTHAIYPGSSPYILAVGATQLVNSTAEVKPVAPYCQPGNYLAPCAQDGTEIVCSPATGALIASGGGFSRTQAQPAWQKAAVAKYLSLNSTIPGGVVPPSSMFISTGRAYPDVSALGHNYILYSSGSATQVDGTSASTPVWAGVIAVLNSLRAADGKKPLGLVQPLLYQHPEAFTDVIVGNNDCTESSCGAGSTCTTGYSAAPGWDAATGLGTPIFSKLVKIVSNLP